VAYVKAPILAGHVIAHQDDLAWVAAAKRLFIRQADIFDLTRTEAISLAATASMATWSAINPLLDKIHTGLGSNPYCSQAIFSI